MPRQSFTLTDVDRQVHLDELDVGPADVGGASQQFAVRKKTLRGGLRDGVDVVEVDNGRLRFVLLPGRGMGIWRAWCGAVQLGWPSPVKGPVHPKFVSQEEAGGIGWLRGFDELLCRCGLEYNGPPEFDPQGKLKHTLHGRIANLPAHLVELAIDPEGGEIAVAGTVDETHLFGNNLRLRTTVSTRFGEPRLKIVDSITNISQRPAELELLYHINFGPPLAAPGARVFVPVSVMAPRDRNSSAAIADWQTYGPEQPGSPETVLYFKLAADAAGRTSVLLANPAGRQGVGLRFNRQQLPCFALWKSQQALDDGYVTGLEPAINFPNVKSFERAEGRVGRMQPGDTRVFEIDIEVFESAAGLERARQEIDALQRTVEPRFFDQPQPRWSPG